MIAGEVFRRYCAALDRGDLAAMGELIDEDFRLEGAGLDGIGKREFLGAMKSQLDAFPDYSENPGDIAEAGDIVHFVAHVTGTHMGVLTFPGLEPIPATGRRIVLPPEPAWVRVRDARLVLYHVDPVQGGGVQGIMNQLRVPSE